MIAANFDIFNSRFIFQNSVMWNVFLGLGRCTCYSQFGVYMNVSIRDPRTGQWELVPYFSVLIGAGAVWVLAPIGYGAWIPGLDRICMRTVVEVCYSMKYHRKHRHHVYGETGLYWDNNSSKGLKIFHDRHRAGVSTLVLTLIIEVNIKLIFWNNFLIRKSIFWWCELSQVSRLLQYNLLWATYGKTVLWVSSWTRFIWMSWTL